LIYVYRGKNKKTIRENLIFRFAKADFLIFSLFAFYKKTLIKNRQTAFDEG